MKFNPRPDGQVRIGRVKNQQLIYKSHFDNENPSYPCPKCRVDNNNITPQAGKKFGYCQICGLKMDFFLPFPMQQIIASCTNATQLIFTGVGFGKTFNNMKMIADHAYGTPKAFIIITAQNIQQLETVVLESLMPFIDEADLVVDNSTRKILKNGTIIELVASKKAGSLKSRNATMFVLVEAQGVDYAIFLEAQQRARSPQAMKFAFDSDGEKIIDIDPETGRASQRVLADKTIVIAEGNIVWDSWPITKGILRAHTIIHSSNINPKEFKKYVKPKMSKETGQPVDTVAFLGSPLDNPILPETYITKITAGESKEWIDREIYCKLMGTSGHLMKGWREALMTPEEVVPHYLQDEKWQFIEAMDFSTGIHENVDPTVYVLGAYNWFTGTTHYLDVYSRSGGTNSEDVQAVKSIQRTWGVDRASKFSSQKRRFFIGDPSGATKNKNIFHSDSQIGILNKLGLRRLRPAFKTKEKGSLNDRSVLVGLRHVRERIIQGQLKIHPRLEHLIAKEWDNMKLVRANKSGSSTKLRLSHPQGDHLSDCIRMVEMHLPIGHTGQDSFKIKNYKKQSFKDRRPDYRDLISGWTRYNKKETPPRELDWEGFPK